MDGDRNYRQVRQNMNQMRDPIQIAVAYQRELFALCAEFFMRATGKNARAFSTIALFPRTVRSNADALQGRGFNAFQWFVPTIRQFYANNAEVAFEAAKQLGGHKLVLGGSSRFLESQLKAVATSALYSDTVFVPDPIMPWVEKERDEERFRHVLLIQAAHALLHLQPLIDAKVSCPSVLVFPSWEKYLEENDETTKVGQRSMVVNLFCNVLEQPFDTIEEVIEAADKDPQNFLNTVEAKRVFIPPNGHEDNSVAESLVQYVDYLRENRSKKWVSEFETLPIHRQVLSAIWERLMPQYHLLENAEEMNGHPLLAVEQQTKYFKLVCATSGARLQSIGLLEPQTLAAVEALSHKRLTWLSSVPLESIARLKEDGATLEFRTRLNNATERLHASALDDVNRVAAEVCYELADMITTHDKQQRDLKDKYDRIHGNTLALGVAGASVAFAPVLAPLLGAATLFPIAAKYGKDKVDERAERRAMSRSLTGVLAIANSKDVLDI